MNEALPHRGKGDAPGWLQQAGLNPSSLGLRTASGMLEEDSASGLHLPLPSLESILPKGLPHGRLIEWICPGGAGGGGQTVLLALLEASRQNQTYAALVDAANAFDPAALLHQSQSLGEHLLWVRCHGQAQAMKALDVLLRDDNFPLVVADLRPPQTPTRHDTASPRRNKTRPTPSSAWYRLQRIARARPGPCIILSPHRLVPAADLRLRNTPQWTLADLTRPRNALRQHLTIELERTRSHPGEDETHQAVAS